MFGFPSQRLINMYTIIIKDLSGLITNQNWTSTLVEAQAWADINEGVSWTTTGASPTRTIQIIDLSADYDTLLQETHEARKRAYPPIQDYVDSQAKISSTDASMQAKGQTELSTYLAACLAVKELYPLPVKG